MPFDNPLGWYAFASLLVLIILYLIRPKPRQKTVSSLMFFIKDKGFLRHSMLLRRLLHNLLLLLQLLAVLLLCFSITAPYMMA
ncbi:MAG: BatA domain-containing protein, partial [Candidatus Woesearchaeota archaeon]